MGSRPNCDPCQSDEYLVFEHVRIVVDPARLASPMWELEFWCGECETFYGFTTLHPPKDPHVVRTGIMTLTRSANAGSIKHS
ncbi:hypothetical protein JOF47_001354 [Paeniglutamicibacter kerguelensis]|uniref:Uncharacterized protein n=1 Tax=Paeniglutamicibacter kerguelensis TaxID=254788 RepID=A0ABS4XBJ7_9MICC|nr:hypothetical protein [Paeniglutamicibacter kerguelensis]